MTDEVATEAIVARLRPNSRALFWPTVALVAVIGATAYFFFTLPGPWMNIAALAGGGVLAILLFLVPLLRWLSRNYVVTTRRLVLRSGLFVRLRQEMLHSRGYDVSVRRSGLQLLFRSGDVLINTGLEHPVLLRDVPHADLVQSALHDLMEKSLNPIAARRQQEQVRPSERPGNDETTAWGVR